MKFLRLFLFAALATNGLASDLPLRTTYYLEPKIVEEKDMPFESKHFIWIPHPFCGQKLEDTRKNVLDYLEGMRAKGYDIIGLPTIGCMWIYKKRK